MEKMKLQMLPRHPELHCNSSCPWEVIIVDVLLKILLIILAVDKSDGGRDDFKLVNRSTFTDPKLAPKVSVVI
jgi:hypothetical protein